MASACSGLFGPAQVTILLFLVCSLILLMTMYILYPFFPNAIVYSLCIGTFLFASQFRTKSMTYNIPAAGGAPQIYYETPAGSSSF